MDLSSYLSRILPSTYDYEGNIHNLPAQQERILQLLQSHPSFPSLRILEIGFNAGHSAELFLSHTLGPVISFDLGEHEYTAVGKSYLDQKYPTRHTLIVGDSTKTVPTFLQEHPEQKMDIIFIDGGHTYDVARSDLQNILHMTHKDTLILMDDVIMDSVALQRSWTLGPTKTWIEHMIEGKIHKKGYEYYGPGRGMVWGTLF